MQNDEQVSRIMQITLKVLSGGEGEPEKTFHAREGEIVLGRASKSGGNIPLASDKAFYRNPVMSRKHCTISWNAEAEITVQDEGSTHGTRILRGTEEIELGAEEGYPSVPLHDQDILVLGREVRKGETSGGFVEHSPLTLLVSIKPPSTASLQPPPSTQPHYALSEEDLIVSDDEEEPSQAAESYERTLVITETVEASVEMAADEDQEQALSPRTSRVIPAESESEDARDLDGGANVEEQRVSSPLPSLPASTRSGSEAMDESEIDEVMPSSPGLMTFESSQEEHNEEGIESDDEEKEDTSSDPSSDIFDEQSPRDESDGHHGNSDTSSGPSDDEAEVDAKESASSNDTAMEMEGEQSDAEKAAIDGNPSQSQDMEDDTADSPTIEEASGIPSSPPSSQDRTARFTLPMPKKPRNVTFDYPLPTLRGHITSTSSRQNPFSSSPYASNVRPFSFRSVQATQGDILPETTETAVVEDSRIPVPAIISESLYEDKDMATNEVKESEETTVPETQLEAASQSTLADVDISGQAEDVQPASQDIEIESTCSDRATQFDSDVASTSSSKRSFDEISDEGHLQPETSRIGQFKKPRRARQIIAKGLAYTGVFAMGAATAVVGLALMPDEQ